MILRYERSEVICMVARGEVNKRSVRHWDICKALSEGKTQDEIAGMFDMDPRNIRYIKEKKCKNCQ